MSRIVRCPHFRGCYIYTDEAFGSVMLWRCPLNPGVSLWEGFHSLHTVAQEEEAAYNQHKAERRSQVAEMTRNLKPQALGQPHTHTPVLDHKLYSSTQFRVN